MTAAPAPARHGPGDRTRRLGSWRARGLVLTIVAGLAAALVLGPARTLVAAPEAALPGACWDSMATAIFSPESRFRVLVLGLTGADRDDERFGLLVGRAIAAELRSRARQEAGMGADAGSGLDLARFELHQLPCHVADAEAARHFGEVAAADLVIWGSASCPSGQVRDCAAAGFAAGEAPPERYRETIRPDPAASYLPAAAILTPASPWTELTLSRLEGERPEALVDLVLGLEHLDADRSVSALEALERALAGAGLLDAERRRKTRRLAGLRRRAALERRNPTAEGPASIDCDSEPPRQRGPCRYERFIEEGLQLRVRDQSDGAAARFVLAMLEARDMEDSRREERALELALHAVDPDKGERARRRVAILTHQESCRRGDGNACAELGRYHASGWGMEEDHQKAAELFERSCELEDARGCWFLSQVYDQGFGVEVDRDRALVLLARSCDGEDRIACLTLAERLILEGAPERGLERIDRLLPDQPQSSAYILHALALVGGRSWDEHGPLLLESWRSEQRRAGWSWAEAAAYLEGRPGAEPLLGLLELLSGSRDEESFAAVEALLREVEAGPAP